MMNLLPMELWDFGVRDLVRAAASAARRVPPDGRLALPELGPAFPIRSARAAIIIALRALELNSGARIGVPLYCCPVVFKAVREAGCVPLFIDVDPQTYCLSLEDTAAKAARLDALIAVHMFGNVADMAGLRAVMGNRPIVEDCAQSLGSRRDGRPAGGFGDIAVFSFRSGKYLSVGEGGGLYAGREDLRARVAALVDAAPASGTAEELVHVATTFLRSKLRSRPLYGLVGTWIWGVYNRNVDFVSKSPIALGRIHRSDLALARARLLALESLIRRQRANAAFYDAHLALDPAMRRGESPGARFNRYLYPLVFPSTALRDAMAARLRAKGVGTARPYEDVIAGAAQNYGYAGDCPAAEALLRRTLIIPSHYKLRQRQVERICRSVNEAWARVAPRVS